MSGALPRWFVLAILVVLPVVTSASASTPDAATFRYLNGFDASGQFDGSCQVAGFRFDDLRPQRITISGTPSTLRITHTWVNETSIGEAGPFPVAAGTTREQRHVEHPLSGDHATITLPQGSHAYLTHRDDESQGALHTDLTGATWFTGPARATLPAGPDVHYVQGESGLFGIHPGINGPARWLETDQEAYDIQGDGYIILAGAFVHTDTFSIQLPPHRQIERGDETPAAETVSVHYTRAALAMTGLTLHASADQGRLACAELTWGGDGAVTFRRATGQITIANENETFAGQELTLNGRFDADEVPTTRERPWGQSHEVDGTLVGRFAAGTDYLPLAANAARGPEVVVAVSIISIFIAMLLAWRWEVIAGLFTRELKGDPLDHPVRAVIHELAHQAPGSNLSDAVRICSCSYSTVRHHARRLQNFGLISTHQIGGQVQIYPPATRSADAQHLDRLRDASVRFVVDAARGDGVTLRQMRAQLQKQFDRPGYWATRVITRAEKAGLLERERTDDGVVLRSAAPPELIAAAG